MKIGIVDPYSTGSQLAERLASAGAELVHIDSGLVVPATMRESYVAAHFASKVTAASLLNAINVRLELQSFDWIIAGSESGVAAADALARFTARPLFTSTAPSKFDAGRLLESAGLRSPRTDRLHSTGQLDVVVEGHRYPLVVKPLWSATGDGVRLCGSRAETEEACAAALDRPNIYGALIDEVLIQEYLPGDEYYCNTVSYAGNHAAIEVWRYGKRRTDDGGWVYASEEYVPADNHTGAAVAAYCLAVLEALEFQNGAAHLEVMVNGDEVALVEANYRLAGATDARVIDRVLGNSQVKALASLLTGDIDFGEATRINPAILAMRNVFLLPKAGGVVDEECAAALRALPTVQAVDLHMTSNNRDAEGTLLASPGFVFLAAENPLSLIEDELTIRRLEEAVHV